jgi:hypothetical protein
MTRWSACLRASESQLLGSGLQVLRRVVGSLWMFTVKLSVECCPLFNWSWSVTGLMARRPEAFACHALEPPLGPHNFAPHCTIGCWLRDTIVGCSIFTKSGIVQARPRRLIVCYYQTIVPRISMSPSRVRIVVS